MSFMDCVWSAQQNGRFSQRKARQAEGAYNREYARSKAAGRSDDAADAEAAMAATSAMTSGTRAMKWRRINELRKSYTQYTRISSSTNLEKTVIDIMRRVENTHRSLVGMAQSRLAGFINKYKPKYGGWHESTAGLDELVHGFYGGAVDRETQDIINEIKFIDNWMVDLANLEGASIARSANWRLPQTHDRIRIKRYGDFDTAAQIWIDDHVNRLDWNIIEWHGAPVPANMRRQVLREVYDGIMTEGYDDIKPGQHANSSLATRMERSRFLYYKDAQSWIDMQEKYGHGNAFQQIIGHIDNMTRNIAMMNHFGPSPSTMRNFIENSVRERAGQLVQRDEYKIDKVKSDLDLFESMWKIFTFDVVSGQDNWMAATGSTVRTVTSAMLLGKVILASQTDHAIARHARRMWNMPRSHHIQEYLRAMLDAEGSAEHASRLNVIFSSGTQMATMTANRYMGMMDGPAWARRFNDGVMRTGGAVRHTQAMSNLGGIEWAAVLQRYRNLAYDKHPWAHLWDAFDITPEDYRVMMAAPATNIQGADFLVPGDLARLTRATRAQVQAALKFGSMQQSFIDDVSPRPDLRTRAFMGEEISPTTFKGQRNRWFTVLTSFPATIHFRHLYNAFSEATPKSRIQLMAQFFVEMTLFGAFVTQLKLITSGYDLQDMNPATAEGRDFWMRSVLNGGSLGIAGDMIMDSINRMMGGNAKPTPPETFFKKLWQLTGGNVVEAFDDKPGDLHVGKDALEFISAVVPEFPVVGLLFERAVADELLKSYDPAAYSKKIMRQQKYAVEEGKTMWWATGRSPEMPAYNPDF